MAETPIPIPDPTANYLMNFFLSRDNNADPATNVGQQARMWWNPTDNTIYVSDGVTPGGVPVTGGGGGGVGFLLVGRAITPVEVPLVSQHALAVGTAGGNVTVYVS